MNLLSRYLAYNVVQVQTSGHVHSVTQKEVQESIVKSFSCATASLRKGCMYYCIWNGGIDCAGVNQVIHWRPSADVVELGKIVRHLVQ